MPADDRGWVLDAAAAVPGVHGAYHLVDPATGNGLSVAFFEDEAAAQAAHKAIEKRAEEIGWNEAGAQHPACTNELRCSVSGLPQLPCVTCKNANYPALGKVQSG
ncbi:hypothetical protein [Streptomyces sp. NBC_01614]